MLTTLFKKKIEVFYISASNTPDCIKGTYFSLKWEGPLQRNSILSHTPLLFSNMVGKPSRDGTVKNMFFPIQKYQNTL